MTEIDKYRDEIPKEETFDEEQYRISEEHERRKKKDRLADYAPMPSEAFLKSVAAERERKREIGE